MGSPATRPLPPDVDSTARLAGALQRYVTEPGRAPQPDSGAARPRPAGLLAASLLWCAAAAAAVAAGASGALDARFLWLVLACLMLALAALVGMAVCGRVAGILVGAQNLMSLSRFQMLLWALLLLSAYLAVVIGRLGRPDPLALQAGPALLALVGIVGASSLAAPLLATLKRRQAPQPEAVARAAGLLGRSAAALAATATGLLAGKADPRHASLADLFRGDEIGNAHAVDLSKVQMFGCTLAAALVYGAGLYQVLGQAAPVALPAPSPSLLALLALSHAGYLAGTCIRHTAVDGEARVAAAEPASPSKAELAIQAMVASAQRSQELVRAIERSTAAQARYTGSLAEGVARLLAGSSQAQERSGRDIGDAIDGLAESLGGLQAAARTQARSSERILDVTRRLEELAREQGQLARRR